jgi:putative ABC transport system permease protein
VLVVPVSDKSVHQSLQALKNELLKNPNIISATGSSGVMGMSIGGNVMFGESESGMQEQGGILGHFVGDDYLKTMGISLVSGRDFRPGENIDEDGMYIANEAVVKLMGWGDQALGKKVTFWGGENPGTVIGVVKDFNASSLRLKAEPMFIVKGHWNRGYLQIRLTGKDLSGTIEYVKKVWSRYDINHPFEYFFLDQRFNEQYKDDVVQNKLLSLLSYICIFISLLGLIGLSAFTATQRTKEIGVRKILGASIQDIIILLSTDVILLTMISSVLVIPLSWWVISKWLENFAYQTELNFLLYGIIGIAAMGLVFLVILFQSLKTANANPVDSLKYE